jgi:hypothetical protein
MIFSKIQLTRQNTLNVTYKTDDGDVIDFKGGNVVHKDLRQAIHALIPHLAVITEQREAQDRNLKQVQSDRITDDNINSVYKRLDVDCVNFSDDEGEASLSGLRILTTGGIVKLTTPSIRLTDEESYTYHNELAADLEAVKYEAKAYIEDKKWGIKQSEIAFESPFEGVEAQDVPEVSIEGEQKPKKRGRKSKAA